MEMYPNRRNLVHRLLVALVAATVLSLAAAPAHAMEVGIQDAWAPAEQMNEWATTSNARWERIIAYIGEPGVAEKIRASHTAGRKVILTVGGLGTRSDDPSFTRALRYIQTLPAAERYTISNEPDLDGVKPCSYRKGWLRARRTLGSKLLFGDFSPHRALRYTQRVRVCGPLPAHLDFAVHPYQDTDPLATGAMEASIGNLHRARTWLRRNAGVRVSWWLTEFAYNARRIDDERQAWLWPRALQAARRIDARILVLYTAQGPSWDTRPREQAWEAIRTAVATF